MVDDDDEDAGGAAMLVGANGAGMCVCVARFDAMWRGAKLIF